MNTETSQTSTNVPVTQQSMPPQNDNSTLNNSQATAANDTSNSATVQEKAVENAVPSATVESMPPLETASNATSATPVENVPTVASTATTTPTTENMPTTENAPTETKPVKKSRAKRATKKTKATKGTKSTAGRKRKIAEVTATEETKQDDDNKEKSSEPPKKRAKKKYMRNYGGFIQKLLKSNPKYQDFSLTRESKNVLHNFLDNQICDILSISKDFLMRNKKRSTLAQKDISAAIDIHYSGDLARFCKDMGNVAVLKYKESKVQKIKKVKKSKKAGLVLPVGRIHAFIKNGNYASRVSECCSVFLTGAMQYLCSEILSLACDNCMENKKVRIKPKHIKLGLQKDSDLYRIMDNAFIANGACVIPSIHESLLPKHVRKSIGTQAS